MTPSERIVFKPRELTPINWDNPRYNVSVQPGTSQVMVDRWTNGGLGFLTDLGVLWVPIGPNNDSFFYMWYMDGVLVEKILRVVGAGGSVSSTVGSPTPQRFDPPIEFHRRMQIIAYNNDPTLPATAQQAETYAGGYNLMKWPNT